MCRWLKKKPRGIYRVLHSAAAIRRRRMVVGEKRKQYHKAYDYLRKRIRFLDYCEYRRNHLPIGSGVTEAACKTVFTQRLKQSGTTWSLELGQWIVDLRVVHRAASGLKCIKHICKRRIFLRWGLRRVRGRKSPEKPHNPWHRRDHTLRDRPGDALDLRAQRIDQPAGANDQRNSCESCAGRAAVA